MSMETNGDMVLDNGEIDVVEQQAMDKEAAEQQQEFSDADLRGALSIWQISYGRTFNLGNFESERIDVTVRRPYGWTGEEALDAARQWVLEQGKRLRGQGK
jgi:hypothetical protein